LRNDRKHTGVPLENMCGRYELDGFWSLIGECYVRGLMVGEAVRAVGKPGEELDDVILS